MEKFDLERALAGEPVCTRDGRDVTQLVKFDAKNEDEVIFGVIDEEIYSWTIDGKWDNMVKSQSPFDIFMKPKENAIWVNLYKSKEGHLYTTGVEYPNEESAKESADDIGYLRTIKIVE